MRERAGASGRGRLFALGGVADEALAPVSLVCKVVEVRDCGTVKLLENPDMSLKLS